MASSADQPPTADTVFLTADPGSPVPAMLVGGITVLERKLREAARRGVRRAVVSCHAPLPAGLPPTITVERITPGAPAPAGATAIPVDEVAGVQITDEPSRREAERRLYQTILAKSYQGPADAVVHSKLSGRLTRLLAHTSLTPNQITMLAFLIGVGAPILLLVGPLAGLYAAAGLLELNLVLDTCDGEIARLKLRTSKIGQWLDNVFDDVLDSMLVVAFGMAAGGPFVWVGVAGGAIHAFTQLWMYRWVVLAGGDFGDFRWWFETGKKSMDEVYDLRSPLVWLRSLGRRDVYVFLWAILCALTAARVPVAMRIAAVYGFLVCFTLLPMTLIHLVKGSPRARA